MADTRTFSPDTPVYFPDRGEWAKPGDTVTVDPDGVVTGIKVKGQPFDPNAPELVEPEPIVEPAEPDAPKES